MRLDKIVERNFENRRVKCLFQAETPVSEIASILYASSFGNPRCKILRDEKGIEVFFDLSVDVNSREAQSSKNLTAYLQQFIAEHLFCGRKRENYLVSATYVRRPGELVWPTDWTRERYPFSSTLPETIFNERGYN